MKQVFVSAWAILLGLTLMQVGNSMQATLMGVRGSIEGFTTLQLSLISSAYFLGFLFGSRLSPWMIQRVGHVRVFAALGSFVSATLILYPVLTHPYAWIFLRVLIGFSICGIYVTTESWLNNASTNDNRGQVLSAYLMAQMVGLISGQALLSLGDPSGFIVFIIPSVLVSLAFAPILLAVQPTPAFEATRPMRVSQVYQASPLGFVGIILLGFIYAAQFGMSAVYATKAGLSLAQTSLFVSCFFIGGMVFQYPIGWLSDRMDRRILILALAISGSLSSLVGIFLGDTFEWVLAAAVLTGGFGQPLYGLLIAYVNDYLDVEDMAAASGGLLFANGLAAIVGPPIVGFMLEQFGARGFWVFLMLVTLILAGYSAWRITRRQSVYAEQEDYDAVSYTPVTPATQVVAIETAQELYAEAVEEQVDTSSKQ